MRIAIVNDLLTATEALRRAVRSCPDYTIAWMARDGAEAVRKCAEDRPDIILMDLIMPVMNGVEATRLIMRDSPCAILVVTATVDGNMTLVFEAMGCGALDAVNTPVLGTKGDLSGAQPLLYKIETIGHLVAPSSSPPTPATMEEGTSPAVGRPFPLVALGASTGGPTAVAEVLSGFPSNFSAAMVIIQHVDREFAPNMAVWLGTHCKFRVEVASPGCRPEPGVVWLAGTNDHMVLTAQGTLEYRADPAECFYRPSVDVFFKSAAAHWPARGAAALLTGMGSDGGEGLLALRQGGWRTIAQDEATSIVYGMPRAAARLKAAEQILPIKSVANAIIRGVEKLLATQEKYDR